MSPDPIHQTDKPCSLTKRRLLLVHDRLTHCWETESEEEEEAALGYTTWLTLNVSQHRDIIRLKVGTAPGDNKTEDGHSARR